MIFISHFVLHSIMIHSHWMIHYRYQKLHMKVTVDVNGLSLLRKLVLNPLFKYIVNSWASIAQLVDWWHNRSQSQTLPMPAHRYVEENSLATILVAKRSAGATLEMNLREWVTHTLPPSANKAVYSGFETQNRCHQKSKTGVSVTPQKGLMSCKRNLKKTTKIHCKAPSFWVSVSVHCVNDTLLWHEIKYICFRGWIGFEYMPQS